MSNKSVNIGEAIVEFASQTGIAGFKFNLPKREQVKMQSDITDYYTDLNSPVQDHIARKPIEITMNGKSVLIIDCKKIQNIYENDKKYDIILVYGKKSYEFEAELTAKFESSQVIISEEGKTISVT